MKEKLREEKFNSANAPRRRAGKIVAYKSQLPITVPLTDELKGSMRLMQPKGSAAFERFDSMHKRNKMELGRVGIHKGKGRYKDILRSTMRGENEGSRGGDKGVRRDWRSKEAQFGTKM